MPTIGKSFPSLIDSLKGSQEGAVVELLSRQNPVLDDAIATECNIGAVHRQTIRTGLPTAAWGRLYQGIPQSKSAFQQVDDTTGFLEAASNVDTRLLKVAKDAAKVRLTESAPYIETMNQEMARAIFYHNTATTPEKIKGLGPRYSVIGGGGAGNQVIDGGGGGDDNTSIWFVTWGDHATSMLYPEGTKAGIEQDDKGEVRVTDVNGNPYYAKEVIYTWHNGMFVKDYRYNSRIANIDVSDMLAGNVDLWALMRKAYYRLQTRRRDAVSSRIAIYMNRDVLEVLDALSSDRSLTAGRENYVSLKEANIEGKEVLTYRGIPIREVDALMNTEERVLAAA